MKTRSVHTFLLPMLLAGLGLMTAGRVPAQTFTVLHSFPEGENIGISGIYTNSDGRIPGAGLVLSGNTLYGAAGLGGTNGDGTLFALNTVGSNFAVLHTFTGFTDGLYPSAALIVSGNTLLGTTPNYVFAINTNGLGFTNFYGFTNSSDASKHNSDLILSGDTLYGTEGDSSIRQQKGGVYAVNTDGTGFMVLHTFGFGYDNSFGGLVLSGGILYGTTAGDGNSGYGSVFAINTNGLSFTNLYSFTAPVTNSSGVYTNSDGWRPESALVLSGNTLYGTALYGGINGDGTVFAINTDGSGFTNLHNFASSPFAPFSTVTNSDGAYPEAGLILSGNTLYGTTSGGGTNGDGTVFAVNTDGTGFTDLYTFTAFGGQNSSGSYTNSDGADPTGELIISANTLYGTAQAGGAGGGGTVFSLVVPITLFYQNTGDAVVLSWNDPSFVLQAAPAVTGTYTNIPGATSPYTNSITGPQQYFRLLVSQ